MHDCEPLLFLWRNFVMPHSSTASLSLLRWTDFHPFAPSIDELRLEKANGQNDWKVIVDSRHAILPRQRVLGKISHTALQHKSLLLQALREIFIHNGVTDLALFESVPSAIAIERHPLLSREEIAPFVQLALRALDPSGIALAQRGCAIAKHMCDPWTRSTEELLAGNSASTGNFKLNGNHQSIFNQWWVLASDPWHARTEFAACAAATIAAIEILSRKRAS